MNINIIDNNKKLEFINESVNLYIDSNKSIDINIKGNVELFLCSNITTCNVKINIIINTNSNLNVFTFINSSNSIFDFNISFIGEYSNVSFTSSIIGSIKSNIYINHSFNNTNSNIDIRGVNNNYDMNVNIIEEVEENINNCNIVEKSKIINIRNAKTHIEPILLIKSNNISASHSSIIKNIDNDYIEYFKSRGINELDTIKLIKEGFLLEFFDNEQKTYIKERNYEY